MTKKGQRELNEDHILIRTLPNGTQLFGVADGIGGYLHGEIAAQIVLQTIATYLSNINSDNLGFEDIQKAFECANRAISRFRHQKLNGDKMGATLAVALVKGRNVFFAWSGDCKIYLFERNCLIFESIEHSLLNSWKEKGLSADFPVLEKFQYIVTRAIAGDDNTWKPSFYSFSGLSSQHKAILCTDGATDLINDLDVLSQSKIVNMMTNYTGKDNASLIYLYTRCSV